LSFIIKAGTSPIVLEDVKKKYQIGFNLDILEDVDDNLTIQDVNSPKWAAKFKKSKKKVPYYAFSKSSFWARVRVQNNSKSQKDWVITQNHVLQGSVTLFKNVKGRWKSTTTGNSRPFKTRELADKNFNFNIRPLSNSLYFLRIKGDINQFRLSISSPQSLIEYRTIDNLVSGIFFGLVIAMVFYNLFIYFSTKNLSYLFYVLYVFFCGIMLFILQGFSQRFLAPNSIWIGRNGLFFFCWISGDFCKPIHYELFKNERGNPKVI